MFAAIDKVIAVEPLYVPHSTIVPFEFFGMSKYFNSVKCILRLVVDLTFLNFLKFFLKYFFYLLGLIHNFYQYH